MVQKSWPVTDVRVEQRTGARRLLRVRDKSDALLPASVFAHFLNDVNVVYLAASEMHLTRVPRRRLGPWEHEMDRYNALADPERYSLRREPLPLVVQDVRIGSVLVELAVEGARIGTAFAVAWSSLWTVGRALRAGPGHLAEWASLSPTLRSKRMQAKADEAEAEVRLREAEVRLCEADAALARIKAAAPNLTAGVVDEYGNELRGEPPAPS